MSASQTVHYADDLDRDAGVTRCGAKRNRVARETGQWQYVTCPKCRRCACMTEPDERGVERVVTHSSRCPEFMD